MPDLLNGPPEGHQLFYPLAQMALFIVLRTGRENGEPMRATIDKVRKRLVYATKKGELQAVHGGLYFVPQVIAWSQEKWPGKFDDLQVQRTKAASSQMLFSDNASCIVLPGNLQECQDALEVAQKQIRLLRTDLKAAYIEIDRLKAVEKKYVNIREKNTESAQRPRKGAL